jgi:phage shock protein A
MFLQLLGIFLGVVAVGLIFMVIFNRQALSRMLGAARAQAGKMGRAAELVDPLAMLQQAVDDGIAEIGKAKSGLELAKSNVNSLQRQVDRDLSEQAKLNNRIKAVLDGGDPNNTARDYAVQLSTVEKNLVINQKQLENARRMYEGFAAQVNMGQEKVVAARQRASQLQVQLTISERASEMAKFAENFTFDPNKVNEGVARAEELIQRQIDQNQAKVDVALEFGVSAAGQLKDDELERNAEVDNILARFKPTSET